MDAIEFLEEDHQLLRGLMARLMDAPEDDPRGRHGIADRLERELLLHSRLEEEVFYPALRQAWGGRDNALVSEALEEHRLIKESALADLQQADPASPSFTGRAKALCELVEHHLHEEEATLFPLARERMGTVDLANLGLDLSERRQAIQSEGLAPAEEPAGLFERAQEVLRQVGEHPARTVGWGVEEAVRVSAVMAGEIMAGARRGWQRARQDSPALRRDRGNH